MIDIPDELIATQYAYNGAAGRAFVAALPGLAGRFLEEWGLRRDGAAMYGMCALVLPVVREADGVPAALKLQLVDAETVGEPVALRAWGAAGAGAVGVLGHDPETGALLLERLDEGRPLSGMAGRGPGAGGGGDGGGVGVPGGSRLVGEVADARRAVTVLGGVLARLAAVPAPEGLRTLGDAVERMLAAAPGVVERLADEGERRLLADCVAAVREVAGEPGDRLLHWDLHYDNILAGRADAGRAGEWVALDPKPLAGDPGFELFPALDNLFDAGEVVWRFDALTEALGMERDRGRARAWTLGRVLQNAVWAVGDGERELAPDHAEIARRLLAAR
ncbi:aminoglycoside phosphotransferase family protein [Streptomyces cyaneofuscatus]|uniref:Aminoglycoside phosphotransferase family protein n=1 Tax=Streptomyces cyaneofuscatus TaxID=66883 RepID=A0ABZ1EZ46_9ACTN|nr:aminoglycoside phosphotransferase family protein [Streptomyces cyaneofuscatus]WSB09299.1 aminoglycoside phosphotransferase family protein [Streptomyces cyaneofuscatus]WSD47165.1 aminoglycoside phosphotransferase family protein [Streptomyces cyaneofuscatus]